MRLPGARASLAVVLCAAVGAVLGVGLGSGDAGSVVADLFARYVDAQRRMIEATSNVNPQGQAEYAVVLRAGLDAARVRARLDAQPGVSYLRESALPGAVVVGLASGDRPALERLRSLPEVRTALPNRGLWICH